MERGRLVSELASAIDAIDRKHPVRVAIDGVGASGKTVLADELAGELGRLGRDVIRASIDGFHRPREERYRRGGESPESYLDDSFDNDAVIAHLLKPLGPDGDRRYRTAVFDFRTDSRVDVPVRTAGEDAVLMFDGVFLLRDELAGLWDFSVFVDAGFHVTLARAMKRDVPLFGTVEATRDRYEKRYIPGERLYLARYGPRERADAVVGNDDPSDATLEWRGERGDS